MKPVVLCALFAPIIYLAFRQKKWYLYLLFAFIGVLPEQFSFKLHESLPLLTVTRILIIIVVGFWMYDKWKTKKFQIPVSLILYFAVNLIISLINLRYGSQEIKRIFLLIFERVLLVIMIADMIHDKEEFNRCIDFAIMGCTALAVIGIIQTTFDYDISTVLHLVKTPTSIQLAKRMGLIRAFGTYNAISFGCYCAFMSLLILYRLYNTKSIWHHIAFSLTLAALICTFTRSAWLCIGAIAFLILVLFRLKLIKRVLPSVGMLIALFLILSCFRPALGQAFIETGKSSINTILKVLPDEFAEQPKEKESKLITDKELFELEYGVLTSKVSQLVEQEYPGAQWIWERPNVRKLLQNGEDVFIRLNKAGGYRRVKVLITNLFVQGLEVMPYTNEQQVKPIEEKEPSVVADEPLKVNYELMAFDWVENHIAELNERCNNAIGDGKDSILLTAEELPVQESWASMCEELKRMDLSAVEMVPEGIKITLLQ